MFSEKCLRDSRVRETYGDAKMRVKVGDYEAEISMFELLTMSSVDYKKVMKSIPQGHKINN